MYQETMDHGEKYLKRVITNILVDLKLNVSQSELWIGPRCGKLLPLSSKYPIIKIYSRGKLEASEQNSFNFKKNLNNYFWFLPKFQRNWIKMWLVQQLKCILGKCLSHTDGYGTMERRKKEEKKHSLNGLRKQKKEKKTFLFIDLVTVVKTLQIALKCRVG